MAKPPSPLRFNGAKLLSHRVRRGWFQQDLSDKTAEVGHRVSRERISMYENGRGTPSPRSFLSLVEALGCKPDDLLDSDEVAAA